MHMLPEARGDASALLREHLTEPLHALPRLAIDSADPLADDDLQLALYLCYELHYRGLDGVDARWEWEPSLLAVRASLEQRFEAALLDLVGPPGAAPAPGEMDTALRELLAADDAPSV